MKYVGSRTDDGALVRLSSPRQMHGACLRGTRARARARANLNIAERVQAPTRNMCRCALASGGSAATGTSPFRCLSFVACHRSGCGTLACRTTGATAHVNECESECSSDAVRHVALAAYNLI
jgi:hypothetical protein